MIPLKRYACTAVAAIAIAGGSPSYGETSDAHAARERIANLRSCEVSDLPPIFDFIKKYRLSTDVDIKLAVAAAESRVAFIYSYQSMKPQAQSSLRQMVKKYENQADERLQVVAATARIELSGLEQDNKKKRADVAPIIDRYKDSKNLDLLQSYAQALEVVAGTERGTEKDDEGRLLAEEAHEVVYALEQQRPLTPVEIQANDICM